MPEYFTPKFLQNDNFPLRSLAPLSGTFFKQGNELSNLAKIDIEKRNNKNFPEKSDYVFPAVIMYCSSFEAYLNENLAFSYYLAESDGKYQNLDLLPKIQTLRKMNKPYETFKKKIKGVYEAYDKNQKGIDTDSEAYQNIIALHELRNSIIHFCPEMVEHTKWPRKVEQAFFKSKPKSQLRTHWTAIFSCTNVSDWAHDTIKDAVQKFVDISGTMDPFDKNLPLYWDKGYQE